MSNPAERVAAYMASEEIRKQRDLNRALDKVVYLADRATLRRFFVTLTVEVEAVDEQQAVVLAQHGEGLRYEPTVERLDE